MGPEESCHWWVDSVLLCSANGKEKSHQLHFKLEVCPSLTYTINTYPF